VSLVRKVLDHLNHPGNDIAIVAVNDIHTEFNTVFEFINECQRRTPDTAYSTKFLRPRDRNEGSGEKIILMSNPARITEHNVLDSRIYIVEQANDLKKALIKYRINT
jgi:hypothetical protein